MIEIVILLGLLVFAVLVFSVILSGFLGFVRTRVPFVVSDVQQVKDVVRELGVSEKDTVYDLGSGDGAVCFAIEQVSGGQVIGFELTGWTYLLSLLKKVGKRSRAQFKNSDFFRESWSEATVVYGYLYPPLMGKVEEKFLRECRPGTVAILRDFAFPHMEPIRVFAFNTSHTNIPNMPRNTPWDRFKLLLVSMVPGKLKVSHEVYIYKK